MPASWKGSDSTANPASSYRRVACSCEASRARLQPRSRAPASAIWSIRAAMPRRRQRLSTATRPIFASRPTTSSRSVPITRPESGSRATRCRAWSSRPSSSSTLETPCSVQKTCSLTMTAPATSPGPVAQRTSIARASGAEAADGLGGRCTGAKAPQRPLLVKRQHAPTAGPLHPHVDAHVDDAPDALEQPDRGARVGAFCEHLRASDVEDLERQRTQRLGLLDDSRRALERHRRQLLLRRGRRLLERRDVGAGPLRLRVEPPCLGHDTQSSSCAAPAGSHAEPTSA